MQVKLKNVRLAFPDLFKAVEFKTGDGKPRFNATFLITPDSENDKTIRAAILHEAKAVYGEKSAKFIESVKGQTNKFAYLDGNSKEYDGYEGRMYLACHSKTRPGTFSDVADPLTGKPAVTTEQDGLIYAGCYVNALAEIYVQKGENPGVRASFSGVQFCAHGDAFSAGRSASADDFDLSEGATAEDLL